MEEDDEIPIILRRPFLANCGALINVQDDKVTSKVNDEEVTFDIYRSLKHHEEVSQCLKVDQVACNMVSSLNPPSQYFMNDYSSGNLELMKHDSTVITNKMPSKLASRLECEKVKANHDRKHFLNHDEA